MIRVVHLQHSVRGSWGVIGVIGKLEPGLKFWRYGGKGGGRRAARDSELDSVVPPSLSYIL